MFSDASYRNQSVLMFEPEARERAEYVEFTSAPGLNPDKLIFPVVVPLKEVLMRALSCALAPLPE